MPRDTSSVFVKLISKYFVLLNIRTTCPWDLGFSRRWPGRLLSSKMWHLAFGYMFADVLEECSCLIFHLLKIRQTSISIHGVISHKTASLIKRPLRWICWCILRDKAVFFNLKCSSISQDTINHVKLCVDVYVYMCVLFFVFRFAFHL
jgi:hypothetical protein